MICCYFAFCKRVEHKSSFQTTELLICINILFRGWKSENIEYTVHTLQRIHLPSTWISFTYNPLTRKITNLVKHTTLKISFHISNTIYNILQNQWKEQTNIQAAAFTILNVLLLTNHMLVKLLKFKTKISWTQDI